VTVPGAAAGWLDTVEKFGSGRVTIKDILTPAIKLAEDGYAWCFLILVFKKNKVTYSFLLQCRFPISDIAAFHVRLFFSFFFFVVKILTHAN
jgi:hypothetical protein